MTSTENKQTIVVIDDDVDVQQLISAYFRPKGSQVICFSDAETALAESSKSGNDWDTVIVDLRLPKMSGVELTVQMKKKLPELPIILITASKSAENAIEAMQKGASDFLIKPIHFPQLQISLDRALHMKGLKSDNTSTSSSESREDYRAGVAGQNKIIGYSPNFLEALDIAKRVATSTANIFISGESGTGKEVFAKFIHAKSKHQKGPFIAINCSAIPENLIESELFGHAKGAFTGAQDRKIGLFEEAQDGTLFLDEIGDLDLSLQSKLLRVLQDKKIRRVGENVHRNINCRIISATHKDLSKEIKDGRFREDLFFRLNVIPIVIPPLRDRPEDLLPLAESFLKQFALKNDSPAKHFSKEAINYILENNWRGNVRELENAIERAVILCGEGEIALNHLKQRSATPRPAVGTAVVDMDKNMFCIPCENQVPTLDEVINKYIAFAVKKNNGARDRTAKEIGIDRKTLYKWMKSETTSTANSTMTQ